MISKGFLWSGTETGLYRFDGIRYVEYGVSRDNKKGFYGFTVTNIYEDSLGTIWTGTEGGGLLLWNDVNGKPEKVGFKTDGLNGKPLKTVTSIHPDKKMI